MNMDKSNHLDLVTSGKPHVLVEDLGRPELSDEKQHHLKKVLRVNAQGLITATNGCGDWGVFNYNDGVLEIVSELFSIPKPALPITIAFSFTKSGKPDFTVQKLTELGVDRIVLFPAENSVPRWNVSKLDNLARRFSRISRSALEQSKGVWLPNLSFLKTFSEIADIPDIHLADIQGDPIDGGHRCLAIGPEGGWSESEYDFALPKVSINRQVLRSETAAVAAGALMTSLRSI
tara:strand:+ start:1369 stop:2067 length:699 start_codon:yes stop_codon:yes gene_type:complete